MWSHRIAKIFITLMVLFLVQYYVQADERLHKIWFYVTLLAGATTAVMWRKHIPDLKSGLIKALMAYLVYQAVNISWSEAFSYEELGEVVRQSLLTVCFVVMAAFLLARNDKEYYVQYAVSIAAALGALAVMIGWNYGVADAMNRLAILGRAGNPNAAGALLTVASIVSFSTIFLVEQKRRIVMLACWLIVIIALLLTQSRGAWLASLSAHGIYLLLHPKISRKMMVLTIASSLVAVTVTSFVINWSSIIERMDGYRLTIWHEALVNGWLQVPLTGLGYRTPFELTLPYGETIYQVHSIYVKALYDGGLLGFGLLLLLGVTTGRILWQHRKERQNSLWLALLINAAIFGAVDYDILLVNCGIEWLLFWLPIAAAFAVSLKESKDKPHENSA